MENLAERVSALEKLVYDFVNRYHAEQELLDKHDSEREALEDLQTAELEELDDKIDLLEEKKATIIERHSMEVEELLTSHKQELDDFLERYEQTKIKSNKKMRK